MSSLSHSLDLCFLQIKGTALPFCQAEERSQPPRGTHQRPAEGGGDPGEEGKAVTGPRPPRPVRRGHGAEKRDVPRGHGLQRLTGGRPCMCAKYLGASFLLLRSKQLYKLLFIEVLCTLISDKGK